MILVCSFSLVNPVPGAATLGTGFPEPPDLGIGMDCLTYMLAVTLASPMAASMGRKSCLENHGDLSTLLAAGRRTRVAAGLRPKNGWRW